MREHDPIEESLIQQAAADALAILCDIDVAAVTRFIVSGDTTFRLRLSIVREAEFCSEQCPKCGSTLLTDGSSKWCSLIGGGQIDACDWRSNKAEE